MSMPALAIIAAASDGGSAGSGLASFLPLLLIVAVFYLLLIRPQQRKARQHQELVKSIGTGDLVVTIGGIHGTVESMDEDTVRIEIAPGTVITMARAAIARRVLDADAPEDEDPTTPDSDSTDTP
jgi:preprotein translocase subunit YajC